MQTKRFAFTFRMAFGLTTLLLSASGGRAESLAIQKLAIQENDSIVFLGNTFAERMHLFGYFETFLHCRFPDGHLRVRDRVR